MSHALSNILANTAKYTDPGGRIALDAEVEGDGIAIAVRDTGIGLSEAALTHVFDLIADVNRNATDSLALILRVSGHDVFVAYSGAEAMAMALQAQLPVIILDIGMPGLSGYEVAEQLRREV
jgi:signal transduction histidine kinase